ncbi:MAG: glycosyltransferase [Spirulina sp. SIO3F2]|nr:glycosyltransferase [Spirulina sp. SIO3F2]
MIQVSVIVPIYNGEADLPDLLVCLARQTIASERVEYLLVDNNSRDRTAAILAQAASDFAAQGWLLRPLRADQIQSSYAGRNVGIRAAQGEILVFTDVDCRPQSDWLTRLIEPFQDSMLTLVVGEVVALPGDSWLEQYAEAQATLSQRHTLNHPFCPYGQTANLAIRRPMFQEIGLFRPYLTTGGDADICWRLLHNTERSYAFVPEAIVQHRHRTSLTELRKQWQRYGRSNRYLHVLYGVPLMRSLTLKETLYRLARWLLKEVPVGLWRRDRLKLVTTPLDLLTFHSRTQGQHHAQFTEAMAMIPHWSEL